MIEIKRIAESRESEADWAYAKKLCAETGRAGDPIEESRAPFFGEQWVGPYEKHCPDWAWLAWMGGTRAGYLTGCPDSRAFLKAKRAPGGFDSLLLKRIQSSEFARNTDTERFKRRLQGAEKSPEECFPEEVLRRIASDYPGHLHVNVSARSRSTGLGAQLMNAFFERARFAHVPGIHVFCGEKPVKFYLRNGFESLGQIEFGEARAKVFALGFRL